MGIPFNDLNRVLDLGFQPLPWGDKGYLPGNLSEIGAAAGSASLFRLAERGRGKGEG
jgi:hypothetical protein